jgi:hypothetical protein
LLKGVNEVKRATLLVLLAALVRVTPGHALETVTVHVDDFARLTEAISEANQRPTDILTRIHVSGTIDVPGADEVGFPPIRSRIQLVGGTYREIDGGPWLLFRIEATGIVGVRDARFVDWSHANFGPVLFENHGTLVLRGVTLTSVVGGSVCGRGCIPNSSAIIHNAASGHLTLDDVRIVDSGISNPYSVRNPDNGILFNQGTAIVLRTQVYLSHNQWEEPITNAGFMRMRNSSLLVRNPVDLPTLPLLIAAENARTEFVNSVFDGFAVDGCQAVHSLGHNTTSAHDCAWSAPGDRTGVSSGLIWRRRSTLSSEYNLVPSAASSIVDSADADWCPDGYTFWDGNNDGVVECDRGAWELVPTSLAEGGINGFYYNPDEDGHYVYIQQTDFTTLVMWNTFDTEGNQAWIYGTGKLESGRSVITKAYINRTGGLTPEGLITDVEAEPWGELQVDMESCTTGLVDYRSLLPEFGSGQFPIERLAYVKQLGCVDPQ